MLSRYLVSQVKHNSFFLVGVALGLWLALATVPLEEEPCTDPAVSVGPVEVDEYEPVREERPLGASAAAPPAGRAVQRPRYYTTELGMRAPLLAAVLSSEAQLDGRVAALNRTAGRLQPALRFFMSAATGTGPRRPPRANVVAFTDGREMLRPFHALKYLADNYLADYDFFFLASDETFINARRLTDLVAGLSGSGMVYMGAKAGGGQYCSLASGVLISNAVLRALHAELDWCVRNSYSSDHHENLGRCVLHAAHTPCRGDLQGSQYISQQVPSVPAALTPALADAVTAHPLTDPMDFYRLHAYVSRVQLERDAAATLRLRLGGRRTASRHPAGFRNASWPAGLRADPGMAAPLPESRFDHLRWTRLNASHALMPDDRLAVAKHDAANQAALELVVSYAKAWLLRGGSAIDAVLIEGARRWEPALQLRYQLLFRLVGADGKHWSRLVEVSRPLGAARLASVPYVTEGARVALLLPAKASEASAAASFLRRYEAGCLQRRDNTALYVVWISEPGYDDSVFAVARSVLAGLRGKYPGADIDEVEASIPATISSGPASSLSGRAALLSSRPPRDALVLLVAADMEFNEDFLNRVRMNTISGSSWFLPVPFARFAVSAHARFVDAAGRRPTTGTGRFNAGHTDILAVYKRDYDAALSSWESNGGHPSASPAEVLAASALRCVRAPEPGLLLQPPASPPCEGKGSEAKTCLSAERESSFCRLELGGRTALAKLLLELQAEAA